VVATEGALRGRELTSRMAWRHRAIAAINADFFDGGDPLGLCIVGGELVSEPFPGRPGVGWTATGQVVMGDPTLDADITRPDGAKQALMGLNRVARAEGDLVLFTSFYGATAQATARGVAVVLDALPRPLRVGAQVQAVVREVREGSSAPIPPAGGVLMGTAGAADFLRALQPGDDGTERPVSNAWLVYDDAQRPTLPRYTDYRIDPPQASLKVGEQVRFRILRGEQPISTWEAVWGTVSIGFIDQWGRFRALRAGRGVVSAYIDGQWLHAPVEVIGDAPPQTQNGDPSGN